MQNLTVVCSNPALQPTPYVWNANDPNDGALHSHHPEALSLQCLKPEVPSKATTLGLGQGWLYAHGHLALLVADACVDHEPSSEPLGLLEPGS